MTAVGADLNLVGQLAAKVLQADHAVVGLRPLPGWKAPFDISWLGQVKWLAVASPRPGYPTCEPP
jgi:hypothetical protein